MSTQSPMPQNDPLLIAFQTLKHTPEYQNAVKWTIAANSAGEADGELWFAFAAGWSARMDYAREKKEALINGEQNVTSQR